MTKFPVLDLDSDADSVDEDEFGDPVSSWKNLNVTRKVRDELVSQRNDMLQIVLSIAKKSSDPRVVGAVERFATQDELVKKLGGRSVIEEWVNAQRQSDSR